MGGGNGLEKGEPAHGPQVFSGVLQLPKLRQAQAVEEMVWALGVPSFFWRSQIISPLPPLALM